MPKIKSEIISHKKNKENITNSQEKDNPEMTHMLKLSDRNFKAAIITRPPEVKKNTFEINERNSQQEI